MLHQEIQDEIKKSMKAKDKVRLSVMRGLLSSFVNELVATRRKPDEMLPDEDAIKVLIRLIKQRKESIEQFNAGKREDLVKQEKAELAILNEYMPEMMSREEVEKVVKAKKEEMGITDSSRKGMLMGAIMKELRGKADGSVVKEIVDNLFS